MIAPRRSGLNLTIRPNSSGPALTYCWRCAVVLLCFVLPRAATAQTWEYSPYNIRLCVAVEHSVDLAPEFAAQVADDVARGVRLAGGAMWRMFPERASSAVTADLLTRLDVLTSDELTAIDPAIFKIQPQHYGRHYVAADGDGATLNADKLLAITVQETALGFHIRIREFDVATRQPGNVLAAETPQLASVSAIALATTLQAIRPLAKVERVEGRTITARLRAGGLIPANSPFAVESGSVLTPVVRRNKRNGEPLPGGIYSPDWSYVAVEARADTSITGSLHSGYGNVIPIKGGPTTERLLLGLKPQFAATHLKLRARLPVSPGTGAPVGPALAGYEIHAKYPGDEKTELVGLTDFSGGIELSPTERPIRLFYIKNGGQLLARLPLVVGQRASITANVLDDDPRLQAEAYIKSLQSRVVDLVARREILAVRIRSKIQKKDFAAAKQLVAEFRSLTTSAQLVRELDDMQRRSSNVPGITGKRIAKVFEDGRKLLSGFLNPEAADTLAREVAEAEKKGPSAAPATHPTTPQPPALGPA